MYHIEVRTDVGGPILFAQFNVSWFNTTRLRTGTDVIYYRPFLKLAIDSHWNSFNNPIETGSGRVGFAWSLNLRAGLTNLLPAFCFASGYESWNVPRR
jgi:hypothetical protein